MQKIMAVFRDGHPDTLVDIVEDGEEFAVIDRWLAYTYDEEGNRNNSEGYINFYSEQI
jgi:hypothetical protein